MCRKQMDNNVSNVTEQKTWRFLVSQEIQLNNPLSQSFDQSIEGVTGVFATSLVSGGK